MPKSKICDVIIETPRGSRSKFAFDKKRNAYRLSKVLPAGFSFPYDFGFIPNTQAADGDPLDVLVLADAPTFPGCIVTVRLLGALKAEQTEDGKTIRNDRLIAAAVEAPDYRHLRSLKDLGSSLRKELEHFFTTYHQTTGVSFRILDLCGPAHATTLIENAARTKSRKKQSKRKAS
jgi:inorganic pyrophosphatase